VCVCGALIVTPNIQDEANIGLYGVLRRATSWFLCPPKISFVVASGESVLLQPPWNCVVTLFFIVEESGAAAHLREMFGAIHYSWWSGWKSEAVDPGVVWRTRCKSPSCLETREPQERDFLASFRGDVADTSPRIGATPPPIFQNVTCLVPVARTEILAFPSHFLAPPVFNLYATPL